MKKYKIFLLYDEDGTQIGYGKYYVQERNAQVHIHGFVHQVSDVGQALCFQGVHSFRWGGYKQSKERVNTWQKI